jgi:copper ion binding protein
MDKEKVAKRVLKVEGMTCGHCVAAVEKAVGAVPGVESVDVDLANKLVSVVCQDDELTHEAIKRAVTTAGYQLAD